MWEFTPFEWGLLGFAGFMLALGIYYAKKGKGGYEKNNKQHIDD